MIKSTNTYTEHRMQDPVQEVYQKPNGKIGVRTVNLEPTMADPQYAEECDVNHIMKKYQATGQLTHVKDVVLKYGDFTQITDYRDMLDAVTYARDAFMELPAEVRTKFQNDPAALLDFVQNPKNYDEALKLGLVQARKEPDTTLKDVKDAINASNTIKKSTGGKKGANSPSDEE